MTTETIFARAGGPRDMPEAEDEHDPFFVIAQLLEKVTDRLSALERRREARAGRDGLDGISVIDTRLDRATGHLLVEFSNGDVRDVGKITADPAPPPTTLTFVRDEVTGRITAARLR
jgi:hypothetical protein